MHNRSYSMKGASGAGLWIFLNHNGEIIPTLQGILVEGDKNKILAIDISYVNDELIPLVKKNFNSFKLNIIEI